MPKCARGIRTTYSLVPHARLQQFVNSWNLSLINVVVVPSAQGFANKGLSLIHRPQAVQYCVNTVHPLISDSIAERASKAAFFQMAQWDLANSVVALVAVLIALNPLFSKIASALYRKFMTWRFPDRATCRQLLWDDVQDNLHSHSEIGSQTFCDVCSSFMWQHENVRLCWEKTAALVFNNLRTRRYPRKKPDQLPLGSSFLRTEARIVLAYLIVTVRCKSFNIIHYLDCRRQGDLTICHLKQPDRVLNLTKEEIDRILEGWPPFYRKTFVSPEGHRLASPLTRHELLKRPGWIVAVGLGRIQPADICVDVDIFKLPCDRVETTLSDVFFGAWPGDPDIMKAIELVRAIKEKGSVAYPEGYEKRALADPCTIRYPENLSTLTEEQCVVTMQIFNSMRIDNDQKRILEPALQEVLSRVCIGFAAVDDYSDSSKHRILVVPPLLQGEQVVYLRDCWTDEVEE